MMGLTVRVHSMALSHIVQLEKEGFFFLSFFKRTNNMKLHMLLCYPHVFKVAPTVL